MRRRSRIQKWLNALFLFSLLPIISAAATDDDSSSSSSSSSLYEWDDDFDAKPEEDPGSWRRIFEPAAEVEPATKAEALYYSAVRKMAAAASSGDAAAMEEAASEIEAAAAEGYPHAQCVVGFMHNLGMMRERSRAKAFLYHSFAADGGNMQSKMALAYMYHSQEMFDKAVELYAELAEVAVKSYLISKDWPVRIHKGAEEEDKEYLRKCQGEEGEDFQILEYQTQILRGVGRGHAKALSWFRKAVEKGNPRAMELLGKIYARGDGIDSNYTEAFEWLTVASKQQIYSAYTGMGHLYAKGYGVEKNYTKAKEYFEKAADNEDADGYYYLGVMFIKGIGVKRNEKLAVRYFIQAANAGRQESFYQLAKMFHTGVGLGKNLQMATALYKTVAEQGPWSSLSRWALESYLKGNVGKAFLFYLRMAELGYEVAQSNAAWILGKYGEQSMCIGESGFCTDAERHQLAYSLWWKASEQGNEYAASLIRGVSVNYSRWDSERNDSTAKAFVECGCK